MKDEISNSLFLFSYLVSLKRITKRYKDTHIQKIESFGSLLGERIVEDFCWRLKLRKKADNAECTRLIGKFFRIYLNTSVPIENSRIDVLEGISNIGEDLSVVFFNSLLNTVFKYLNSNIKFQKFENTILFSFDDNLK